MHLCGACPEPNVAITSTRKLLSIRQLTYAESHKALAVQEGHHVAAGALPTLRQRAPLLLAWKRIGQKSREWHV